MSMGGRDGEALFILVGVDGLLVGFDGGSLFVVVGVGGSSVAFDGGSSSSSEVLSLLPVPLIILCKTSSSSGFKPPSKPSSTVLTLSLEMESTYITDSPFIAILFEDLGHWRGVGEEMFAAAVC